MYCRDKDEKPLTGRKAHSVRWKLQKNILLYFYSQLKTQKIAFKLLKSANKPFLHGNRK